ncbi:MAG: hypothetical protein K1X83_03460 [Oligoflexia bacterium]|nr:hypothetical protein [Oligoflexia bacterium]
MSDEKAETLAFLAELRSEKLLSDDELQAMQTYLEGGPTELGVAPELLAEEGGTVEPSAAAPGPASKLQAADDKVNLRFLLGDMSIPQKIKLAMFGNATCRGALITDPNRVVHLAVLKNPKIQLPEIEEFSRSPHVPEAVLRAIAGTTTWMRNYRVKANLVCNPKAPSDVALRWVKFLNATDLKKLAKSKNVAQVISVAARKLL